MGLEEEVPMECITDLVLLELLQQAKMMAEQR
jgi:hypothetical protein